MNVLWAILLAVALGIMWGRILNPRFSWGAFCTGLVVTAGFCVQAYAWQDDNAWGVTGLACVMVVAMQLAAAHYLADSAVFSELLYIDRLRIVFMSERKKAHIEALLLHEQVSDAAAAQQQISLVKTPQEQR